MTANLSKEQKEIYDMITIEFLTPSQIANRRKTTIRAVYKTLDKLKKKGVIQGGTIRGYKNLTPPPLKGVQKHYFRLHGLQYSIRPISLSVKYQNTIKTMVVLEIAGDKVTLYPSGSIQINQQDGSSFIGQTVLDTLDKAQEHFNKLIRKIENDLNIIIIKDRHLNVRIVAGHMAEVENEMSIELDNAHEKITLYGSDGMAFFKFDKSHMAEGECIHPKKFIGDSQIIFERHMKDWRENDPLTNSELQGLMEQVTNTQKDVADRMDDMADKLHYEMSEHMKIVKAVTEAVDRIGRPQKRRKSHVFKSNNRGNI